MKSIKTVVLTLFSALALSGTATVFADNAATVSSDGFLELTLTEVPVTSTKSDVKKAKPKPVINNRADRKARAKKVQRKKRATAKRTSRARTYRVRSGDTLTKIARKTGVSFTRLVRLNRLYGSKKNHIEVGQRLRLR